MVHFVDGLVERTIVKAAVEPVVPCILHDEENGNLRGHLPNGWERDVVGHAEVDGNGVEEPDLRKLSSEMADEDNGGTVPLLLQGGDLLVLKLILVEPGNVVHNDEGKASAEVDELV